MRRKIYEADDRANKWRRYLDVCHRLYFACPKGLLQKDIIPNDAGLITRSEKGWYVVKAAKSNKPACLSEDTILALLYRGYEEELQMRRLRDRIVAEENVPLINRAKRIGYDIAKRLDQNATARTEKKAYQVIELVNKTLGMDLTDENTSFYEIERIFKQCKKLSDSAAIIKKVGEIFSGWHWDSFDLVKECKELEKMLDNMRNRGEIHERNAM